MQAGSLGRAMRSTRFPAPSLHGSFLQGSVLPERSVPLFSASCLTGPSCLRGASREHPARERHASAEPRALVEPLPPALLVSLGEVQGSIKMALWEEVSALWSAGGARNLYIGLHPALVLETCARTLHPASCP